MSRHGLREMAGRPKLKWLHVGRANGNIVQDIGLDFYRGGNLYRGVKIIRVLSTLIDEGRF